ncbi:MAG: RHS repeat domain-containing protein [Pseudomonadota bacterium]
MMNSYSIQDRVWKRWFWCFFPLVSLLFTLTAHSAPVTRYIHTDPMGSPIAATDENGEILWVEDYKPYGERIRREEKSAPHKRWYTGHVQDDDTGLIYMGARYYDPEIGRFMSPDPVGFDAGNPVSFNKYAYANNNPYRYVDPDGRIAVTAAILGTIGVVSAFSTGYEVGSAGRDLYTGDISAQDLAEDVGKNLAINTAIKAAPGGAVLVFARKAAKKVNPLDGTIYTPKVRRQMQGEDLDHNFPSLVDSQADAAKVKKITGGDGVERTKVELPGSVNGKRGNYRWIIEPDKTVNHRQFERPRK